MSSPSSRTSPASDAPGTSSCMRLSSRRNVDLPQPDGPMSAVTSPAGMTRSTPSSTRWSPNQAHASRASRVAAPGGGPPTSLIAGRRQRVGVDDLGGRRRWDLGERLSASARCVAVRSERLATCRRVVAGLSVMRASLLAATIGAPGGHGVGRSNAARPGSARPPVRRDGRARRSGRWRRATSTMSIRTSAPAKPRSIDASSAAGCCGRRTAAGSPAARENGLAFMRS